MKRIIGTVSWISALTGVFVLELTLTFLDNYILFYAGLGLLIGGIVGALCTSKKAKAAIIRMFESM